MTITSDTQSRIIRKQGIAIAGGIASGKCWLISRPLHPLSERRTVPRRFHEREESKIRHALQIMSFVMEHAIEEVRKRANKEHVRMFVVLKAMVHDPMLLKSIVDVIRKKNYSAYAAVQEVFRDFRKQLQDSNLALIRERANDLVEIEEGLLDALVNPLSLVRDNHDRHGIAGRIVLTRILTPRFVLEMRGRNIRGIIAQIGGPTSHAAILCRTLMIPCVSGIAGVYIKDFGAMHSAINGATGETLFSEQGKDNLTEYFHTRSRIHHISQKRHLPEITLYANLNISDHASRALAAGAQGIGLYRTELEFLAAGKLLSSRQQETCYRNVVMTMMGLPTTIRVLDVRRDKFQPIVEPMKRPFRLDLEGAAFLLSHPGMLRAQARAIGKAALIGPVRLLYPLVENTQQFIELKTIVHEIIDEIAQLEIPDGVMFELVGACRKAQDLFTEADFGSIGTNDLLQDLFGTDRETAVKALSSKRQVLEFRDLIEHVSNAAQKAGKSLTVCGELASDPRWIRRFVDMGITKFSVDIHQIKILRPLLQPAQEKVTVK
ncbi:MAG: hypothetical protein GF401_16600 [Chitinivibrionales bacterium]|nr:hypothetical protein [Chitinivibrionales bacterium]